MFKVQSLHVGYGSKVVVQELNLTLLPGKVYALIGSNGAGKSTILRTLAGLQRPLSGNIELNGRSPEDYTARELSRILSVVLTQRLQLGMQKVFEVVLLGRLPFTGYFGTIRDNDRKIVEESLECVGAGHLAARVFDSLSDGEKQKVMIARALAQQPKIMILDEPTSHLDIKHRIEIMRILKKLVNNQNVTVIMSLHDLDLAMKFSDELIVLKDGGIVYSGMPERVSSHINLSDIYELTYCSYNEALGSIEIENKNAERALVIGGGKESVPVLRMLAKYEVGAVLYGSREGELDYEVARTMGIRVIPFDESERRHGFGNLELENREQCDMMEWMKRMDCVIVANQSVFQKMCNEKTCLEIDSKKVIHFNAGHAEEINNIVRRLQ